MKILLLNPNYAGSRGVAAVPPLGLLYIGSFLKLKRANHDVQIIDFNLTKATPQQQKDLITQSQAQIIGISATSYNIEGALQTAAIAKEVNPELPVILGGPHASALPQAEYPSIDCVVRGEGELALIELIDIFEGGGKIPRHFMGSYLRDIDFIPNFDMLHVSAYKGFELGRFGKQGFVIWSRGCAYNCNYCSNVVWRGCHPRVRYRSPSNIVDELEVLKVRFGIEDFFVMDDELNFNLKWLNTVCDEILRRDIGVAWRCIGRANSIFAEKQTFEKMRRAGCYLMHWGIESGSQRVLDGINKKLQIDQVYKTLQMAKECGMENHGYFMLGLVWLNNGEIQGEEREDILSTIDFATRLRRRGLLNTVQFSIFNPYPGSPIWEPLQERGMLLSRDEPFVPLHEVTFRHPNLSADQLRQLHKKAYINFILDRKFILNRLKMLKEPGGLINFLKQARVALSMILGWSPR